MPFGSTCPLPTYLADAGTLGSAPVDPLIAQIAHANELFLSEASVLWESPPGAISSRTSTLHSQRWSKPIHFQTQSTPPSRARDTVIWR